MILAKRIKAESVRFAISVIVFHLDIVLPDRGRMYLDGSPKVIELMLTMVSYRAWRRSYADLRLRCRPA